MMNKHPFWLAVAFVACSMTACIEDRGQDNLVELSNAPQQLKNDGLPANALTTMNWTDTEMNLGTVKEGQQVEVIFRFTNTGDNPLTITAAQPSCGCTVPQKPEKPIMPGQEGEIKAVFDSKGRAGANHKTITVTANTKPETTHELAFDVNVLADPNAPK